MNLKLTIVVLLVLTFGNSSSMIYCENFEKTRLCDTLGGHALLSTKKVLYKLLFAV